MILSAQRKQREQEQGEAVSPHSWSPVIHFQQKGSSPSIQCPVGAFLIQTTTVSSFDGVPSCCDVMILHTSLRSFTLHSLPIRFSFSVSFLS